MKKRIILLLALLKPVFAASLEDSRIIILAPIFLAALGIIFFIILYIKDNFKKIKNFEFLSKVKNIKIKKGGKKEEKVIKIDEKNYYLEAKKLESEFDKLSPEEIMKTLSGISNSFFKNTLKTDANLTHHEITGFSNAKNKWIEFSKSLEELKFSGMEASKKELKSLTQKFIQISKQRQPRKAPLTDFEKFKKTGLITEIKALSFLKGLLGKRKDRPNFFDFIKHFFTLHKTEPKSKLGKKLGDEIKEETEKFLKIRQEFNTFKNRIDDRIKLTFSEQRQKRIDGLIENCRNLLKQEDIINARKIYLSILKEYYKLPPKDQMGISSEVSNIHKAIDNFEEYKEKMKIDEMAEELKKIKNNNKVYILREHVSEEKDYFSFIKKPLLKEERKILRKEENLWNDFMGSLHSIKDDYDSIIRHTKRKYHFILDKENESYESIIRKGKRLLHKDEKTLIDDSRKIKDLYDHIIRKGKHLVHKDEKTLIDDSRKIKDFYDSIIRHTKRKYHFILDKENESYESIIRKGKRLVHKDEKTLIDDSRKIKDLYDHITRKEKQLFKKGLNYLPSQINRINTTIEELENSFLESLNKKQKNLLKNMKRLLPKKEDTHITQKEKLEMMARELENIKDDKEVYIIGLPTEKLERTKLRTKEKQFLKTIMKEIESIGNYASSLAKNETSLFSINKKNLLYRMNELRTNIENTEKLLLKKLNNQEKRFLKEIKRILPKTKETLQMNLETIKHHHEKLNILNILKTMSNHLKKMEQKGIYSLTSKGQSFIKSFEKTLKSKDRSLNSLLSNMKKTEIEFMNRINKKHVTSPLKSDQERIKDIMEEMHESKMLKIKDTSKLSTVSTSLVREYDNEKMHRLNKEEEKILKRMDKSIKKIPKARPSLETQRKRLRRYGWEIAANKIKNERLLNEHSLIKEEEQLTKKLNNLN